MRVGAVRALVFAVTVLAACGGGAPKEPTITKEQQAGMCRPAVDRLVALLLRGETGSVPLADRIRGALFERCTTDRWGADATDCFARLELIDQAEHCATYLTVPQRDGFQQAIEGAAR